MSAFTPPRADLRGGNQSADSFATSGRIFALSTTLCFFARRFRAVGGLAPDRRRSYSHRLESKLLPQPPELFSRSFRNMASLRGVRECGRERGRWLSCARFSCHEAQIVLHQEITKLLPQANDRAPGEISGLFALGAITGMDHQTSHP